MNQTLKAILTAVIFLVGNVVSSLLIQQAMEPGAYAFSFLLVGLLVAVLSGVWSVDFWKEQGIFVRLFRALREEEDER